MQLPQTSTVRVLIETWNVEEIATVEVRRGNRVGNRTFVNASLDSADPLDPEHRFWIADVPVSTGYYALQVRVIRP